MVVGPAVEQSRAALKEARRAVNRAAHSATDPHLVDLAWKHLLASGYETAWHEMQDGRMQPSPWARAIAGHPRDAGHRRSRGLGWLAGRANPRQ